MYIYIYYIYMYININRYKYVYQCFLGSGFVVSGLLGQALGF